VGTVAWQVTSREAGHRASSQFSDSSKATLVNADSNSPLNANEPATLEYQSRPWPSMVRASPRDDASIEYLDPSMNIFLEQVNPGVSQQGEAIHECPGANSFELNLMTLHSFRTRRMRCWVSKIYKTEGEQCVLEHRAGHHRGIFDFEAVAVSPLLGGLRCFQPRAQIHISGLGWSAFCRGFGAALVPLTSVRRSC